MEVLAKLGIDLNNILIYLVNFGILFGVIAYFVTGPVLKMLEKRRDTIRDNLEKAEAIKREFMEEKQKADAERMAMKTEMSNQLSEMKKELEDRRKEQEEALATRKAKMLEEVRVLVEDEKGKILKKAEQQTLDLIAKVVMHIVSNKIPQEVVKESVSEAWKTYNK
jgi:F-type H+-transporting ATPase subunit b